MRSLVRGVVDDHLKALGRERSPNFSEQFAIPLIAVDEVDARSQAEVRDLDVHTDDRGLRETVAPHRQRVPLVHAEFEQREALATQVPEQRLISAYMPRGLRPADLGVLRHT
jgi:hypothetical protein